MEINFKSRRKEIAKLKCEGLSVLDIAKKYNVSRQAIYQLLKKAEKEGNKVIYNKCPQRINICEICQRNFHGSSKNTKTCSSECRSLLLKKSSIAIDGKWSRYATLDLICDKCSKNFKRTKYLDSLFRHSVKYKKNKNNYCSRECYHNRNYK